MLHATPFARAVVGVIAEENAQVLVQDEGAYLRVLVPPGLLGLSQAGSKPPPGASSGFPGELEVVLSSFRGDRD